MPFVAGPPVGGVSGLPGARAPPKQAGRAPPAAAVQGDEPGAGAPRSYAAVAAAPRPAGLAHPVLAPTAPTEDQEALVAEFASLQHALKGFPAKCEGVLAEGKRALEGRLQSVQRRVADMRSPSDTFRVNAAQLAAAERALREAQGAEAKLAASLQQAQEKTTGLAARVADLQARHEGLLAEMAADVGAVGQKPASAPPVEPAALRALLQETLQGQVPPSLIEPLAIRLQAVLAPGALDSADAGGSPPAAGGPSEAAAPGTSVAPTAGGSPPGSAAGAPAKRGRTARASEPGGAADRGGQTVTGVLAPGGAVVPPYAGISSWSDGDVASALDAIMGEPDAEDIWGYDDDEP